MPIATADLLIFLTASLTLNLTPGNDMMFVLGQSMRSGFRTGTAASLGIATGSLIHLLLVALGVAVILNQHPVVFDAIRYAGAAYLLWIAWKALNATSMAHIGETPKLGAFSAWRDGALVNLLNPKIIVFMFAFGVGQSILYLTAVAQFLWLLFVKEPNKLLVEFGKSLALWLADTAGFLCCATDEKPFPWTSWPVD